MDFNDFRLFLAPEGLPPAPSRLMNRDMERRSSGSDLSLTDYHHNRDNVSVDWLRVDVNGDGEIEALSPADIPTEDCDRMVRSLDLGHESIESEGGNYSFPYNRRSRTLEDSPSRSGSAILSNSQSGRSSDSERIKYKLMSVWNNMKFGKNWWNVSVSIDKHITPSSHVM